MTFYCDAAGLVDAVRPAAGSYVRSVALVVVAATRAWRGGTYVLQLARALAVGLRYVSAVVFSRGHGSPAPRNSRRRAQTGKVDYINSGQHAANVSDPKVVVLEVVCADALVLRRKSLEDDVLELTVRRPLWKVARTEEFAARVELIQKLVGFLARTHSRGFHFGVLRSEHSPRTAVERFAKGDLRALSVS